MIIRSREFFVIPKETVALFADECGSTLDKALCSSRYRATWWLMGMSSGTWSTSRVTGILVRSEKWLMVGPHRWQRSKFVEDRGSEICLLAGCPLSRVTGHEQQADLGVQVGESQQQCRAGRQERQTRVD